MKKTFVYSSLICGCAMMTFTSCNNSDEPNVENEKPAQYSIQLTAPQQKVLSQSNDFAFDVLKTINNEDGNVFVSPYSLGQVLAMLANGAEGQTYDEIATVLKIGDGTSLDDINSYYSTMNSTLTTINSSAKFMVANSLWLNKNYNVLESYKTDMKSFFDAKVETLDFSDRKTVDLINNWVKESTNGLIPGIVDEVDPVFDCAWLLNSLYFRGFWKYFPKKNTYDDTFYNKQNNGEKVKMMKSDECYLNGCITKEELALELTYGGEAFQMMVIMPRSERINDYINALNGEKYAQVLSQMTKNESEVIMPKFKNIYNNDFKDALKAMGMSRVLSDNAQLGKMTTARNVRLSKILQNTSIEVNEEGTIAVATTGGKVTGVIDNIRQIIKYVIDRPFIYLIKERTTGAILFIGKVQSMAGMQ
ncbi:MAG: serpin family protein [Muribaculaceae bacterium]|nr:serpin family protein [Muribaculaceae bacterium]